MSWWNRKKARHDELMKMIREIQKYQQVLVDCDQAIKTWAGNVLSYQKDGELSEWQSGYVEAAQEVAALQGHYGKIMTKLKEKIND